MEVLSQPVWWPDAPEEAGVLTAETDALKEIVMLDEAQLDTDNGTSQLASPYSSVLPPSMQTEEEESYVQQTPAELAFPELSLMLDEQALNQASISVKKNQVHGQRSAAAFQLGPMLTQRPHSPLSDDTNGAFLNSDQTSYCLTDDMSKDMLGINQSGDSLGDLPMHEGLDYSLDPSQLFPGMFDSSCPVSVPNFTVSVLSGESSEMNCNVNVPFSGDSTSSSQLNPDLLNTDSLTSSVPGSVPVACSMDGTDLGIPALKMDADLGGLRFDHMLDSDAFSSSHSTPLLGEYGGIWSDGESLDLIDQAGMLDMPAWSVRSKPFGPTELSAGRNEGGSGAQMADENAFGERLLASRDTSAIGIYQRTPYSNNQCCAVKDPFYVGPDLHCYRHADLLSSDHDLDVNSCSSTASSTQLEGGSFGAERVKPNGSLSRLSHFVHSSFVSQSAMQTNDRQEEVTSASISGVHGCNKGSGYENVKNTMLYDQLLKSFKVQQPFFVPYTDCISSDAASETDGDLENQDSEDWSDSNQQPFRTVASKGPAMTHFQSSFLSFIQKRPKEEELSEASSAQFQSSFLDFIEEKERKRKGLKPKKFRKRKGRVRHNVIHHLRMKRQGKFGAGDCVPGVVKEVDVCTTESVVNDQIARPAFSNRTTARQDDHVSVMNETTVSPVVQDHCSSVLNHLTSGLESQLNLLSDGSHMTHVSDPEKATDSEGLQRPELILNPLSPTPPSTRLRGGCCGAKRVNSAYHAEPSTQPNGELSGTDCVSQGSHMPLGNVILLITDESGTTQQLILGNSVVLDTEATSSSDHQSFHQSSTPAHRIHTSDHLTEQIFQHPMDGSDLLQQEQTDGNVFDGADQKYLLNLPLSLPETSASSTNGFDHSTKEQTAEDSGAQNNPVDLVQMADDSFGTCFSEPAHITEIFDGESGHAEPERSSESIDAVEHVHADSEQLTKSSGSGLDWSNLEQTDDSIRDGMVDFIVQSVNENEACVTDYSDSEVITFQIFDDGHPCTGAEQTPQFVCNGLTILPLGSFGSGSSAVCFSAETPEHVENLSTQHYQTQTLDTSALESVCAITSEGEETCQCLNNSISENKENCQFLADLVSPQHPTLKKMESEVAVLNELSATSSEENKCHQSDHSGSMSSPENSAYPKRLCPCRICGESFESDILLRDHLATHKDGDTFVCGLCDHVPGGYYYMARHMSRHKGELVTVCDSCGTKMQGEVPIKHHRLSCVTESLSRICTTCSATFTSFQDFSDHWIQEHKKQL